MTVASNQASDGRPMWVQFGFDYPWKPHVAQTYQATQLYDELKMLGLQASIADLAVKGYAVIPPEMVAPAEYIEKLRDKVLEVSAGRTGIVPDVEHGSTHESGRHPLGQFMRYVLFEDPVFEPVLTNPVLLGLITYLVGTDALLSLNDAMVKGPGDVALPLHNDNGDKTTAVYADQAQSANINLLLSDYGPGSGSIAFLPGSHHYRREPTPEEMEHLVGIMEPIIAPAGSAIIWPANTWHMALPRTDPGLRLTLLYDFCRGHLQTQSPFRADVTSEILERNPARFTQLMHANGVFPFREEDILAEHQEKSAARHSLFDTHPMWRAFFGLDSSA
jgi:hypothetical protein